MFMRARKGLAFDIETIMRVYSKLEDLSSIKERFYAIQQFFDILYVMSKSDKARELSSSSFANVNNETESSRILKIQRYIGAHFGEEIRLAELASMVNMSESSFSRFFKLSTGHSVSDYIVEVRLGQAARRLINTTDPVSTVCYDCGFNTLSNFNRLFRQHKGCTPTEFRAMYFKTKIIV